MKSRLLLLGPLFLAFLPLSLRAQVTVDQPIPSVAAVHVDASRDAGAKISPGIFGSFLWAEILQNPSLEAGLWSAPHVTEMAHQRPELGRASQLGLPLPWEPLDYAQGNRYQIDYGNAANSWRSLVVIGVPNEPTGILEEVYLPVQRELSYVGSLYARHISGPDGLTVSIREHNGTKVLASAHVDAAQAGWTKHTFTLTIPQGALHRLDPADFVVQVDGAEQVGLDEFRMRASPSSHSTKLHNPASLPQDHQRHENCNRLANGSPTCAAFFSPAVLRYRVARPRTATMVRS